MARLKNGINGPLSGKAGSVVGCSWKGVNYVRGLPGINKKRTEAQKVNQSRFAYVNAWLAPFKPFTSAFIARVCNAAQRGLRLHRLLNFPDCAGF